MRINKFFTEQGLCSRREADRLIGDGRVTINGRAAKLGDQVSPQDVVARDGIVLQRGSLPVYIKYHKPVGVTTTTESHIRRNIIAEIGHAARIFPIGRLDKDSSGLILLTNDGDIVNDILRVEHGHEREYRVEVDRTFDEAFLRRMSEGVMVLGALTRPCAVTRFGRRGFRIILTEGRNRQIRRMCQALGYRVVSLHRERIMHITLDGLQPGEWRDLEGEERARLFRAVGRAE
jgi:23S rRNA pseudouridine2604 synthase